MKAFILSAGLGTRLYPLTNNRPKVMVEVGGKPVLEHLILLCKKHNLTEIVINLHYLPEVITGYFDNGNRWAVNISYSYEPTSNLGGAGALKHAQKLLSNDSFFVLNGDVITNVNLTEMAEFHIKKGGVGTFLVHKTDHPHDSDIVEYDKDNKITKFFRPHKNEAFKPVSKTGTHIFNSNVLEHIPTGQQYSLEKQLIPNLLSRGKSLYAYYSDCYSKDMGTPERLKQVEADYQAGKIHV